MRKAIETLREESIVQIEGILNFLGNNSSFVYFYKSDRFLHEMIVRYGYNKRLNNFLNNLNAQVERLRQISSQTPNRLDKSKKEHLEIVKALKDRNFELASKLLYLLIISEC